MPTGTLIPGMSSCPKARRSSSSMSELVFCAQTGLIVCCEGWMGCCFVFLYDVSYTALETMQLRICRMETDGKNGLILKPILITIDIARSLYDKHEIYQIYD